MTSASYLIAFAITATAWSSETTSTSEFQQVVDSFDVLTTPVGTGGIVVLDNNDWQPAFEWADGTSVDLSNPHMAAGDAFGNVYIADKASHAILQVTPDGTVHTVAGTHVVGFNGDGPAAATTLQLDNPNGIYVLPDGAFYVFDPGNHRIRRVGTDGVMRTVVNDPDPAWYPTGRGLWVSPNEDLIYYDMGIANPDPPPLPASQTIGGEVKKWTPTGGISVVATGFVNLANIAVNPVDGLLYVTDRAEDDATKTLSAVWRIDAGGTKTKVAGNGNPADVGGDGLPALDTFLDQVRGICFRADGSYFLCTHKGGDIWFVDTDGLIHKFIEGRGKSEFHLGDGLHPPILFECLSEPRSVTLTPKGDLLIVTNDSGYLRVVSTVCPPQPPPLVDLALLPVQGSRIRWTGAAGVPYLIRRSASLDPDDWEVIGVKSSTGGLTEFIDSLATGLSRAFYQILPPQ